MYSLGCSKVANSLLYNADTSFVMSTGITVLHLSGSWFYSDFAKLCSPACHAAGDKEEEDDDHGENDEDGERTLSITMFSYLPCSM